MIIESDDNLKTGSMDGTAHSGGGAPDSTHDFTPNPSGKTATLKTKLAAGCRSGFAACVALQILLLAGSAVPPAYTLVTGQRVVFRALPYDPYDVFRGEYASMQYDGVSKIATTEKVKSRDQVYVLLLPSGDHWIAKSLSKDLSSRGKGDVVIRGKVQYTCVEQGRMTAWIDYGISRLYVPQGRSRELQDAKSKTDITVSVDRSGNACIREASVNGRKVYDGLNMLNPFL